MKELSPSVLRKMTGLAIKARGRAYAPYSGYRVGAAVLSESGKIYHGANSETAHYNAIHAEGTAISAMTSAGDRKIRAIVVVGPSVRRIATPCGDCRQRIREFSDGNTLIYAMRADGKSCKVYTLAELLPDSFGPENLAEVGRGPQAKKKKQNNSKRK